jgi:hypothetical protein
MQEQRFRDNLVEALYLISGELEKLRVLKEHELKVRIKEEGGEPFVEKSPEEEHKKRRKSSKA